MSGTHATVGLDASTERHEHEPHTMNEREWRAFVVRKLNEGTQRMDEMQGEVHRSRQVSEQVLNSTSHVVAAFDAAAGAFKVLEWLGKIAKPLLFITGLASGLALLVLEVRRRLGL